MLSYVSSLSYSKLFLVVLKSPILAKVTAACQAKLGWIFPSRVYLNYNIYAVKVVNCIKSKYLLLIVATCNSYALHEK